MVLFLGASGVLGYVMIRDSLLKEWQEIAVLRMERAALRWICGCFCPGSG